MYIKGIGRARKSVEDPWRDITCYVTYSDAAHHRSIVDDSFRYHLELDLEYMKRNHPDHFTEPHNVARAIALYHHFRPQHTFFKDDRWEYIGPQHLPQRPPNANGPDFSFWVDSTV